MTPNAPDHPAERPAGAAPAAPPSPPGRRERMLLAAVAAALVLLLLWLRGGLHPEAPLERMARQSLDLPAALANGRPTLVEFYADWCEACRAMAPAMERVERQHHGAVDVVLLNVDNPRWQSEIERYEVNGIPQLELFNADGQALGRSLGARSDAELEALMESLIGGTPLPPLAGVGPTSSLAASTPEPAATVRAAPVSTAAPIGPRSHG